MNKVRAGVFAGVIAVLAGGAIAEVATKSATPAMTLGASSGYLGKAAPDTYRILPLRRPPEPFAGSPIAPPSWRPAA